MLDRLSGTFLAIAALALPMAALADLTGTVTLPSGTALSLDTGVTSNSGGDILFNGNTGQITPQGSATALVAISVARNIQAHGSGAQRTAPKMDSDRCVGKLQGVSVSHSREADPRV